MLNQRRPVDVVIWRLDRLNRSLRDLLTIMERTEQAGAVFAA
jgi:DNA invertase Pin-like site-specific DNA recombinase